MYKGREKKDKKRKNPIFPRIRKLNKMLYKIAIQFAV